MSPRAALTPQGLLLLLASLLPGSTGIMFRTYTREGLPDWSMTTAERILALKGQAAVLPCNFTYPNPDYQGVIEASWLLRLEGSKEMTIFQCSFCNCSSVVTLQKPCTDGTNQYRLVGDPLKNDLSLEIKNVMAKGSYYCRLELKSRAHAEFQTQYATDLQVFESSGVEFQTWTIGASPGWSMTTAKAISGWRGQSAVLPCNFTYPGKAYQGTVKAIWKMDQGQGPEQITIFQCNVQNSSIRVHQWDECITGDDQYRLVGDPRQNDLSLEVRSLKFSQNGSYYCRVEAKDKWQTKYGTKLSVYAPSRILNLTIEGNNTVVCEVEGNPIPNISWTGPNFSHLPTKPFSESYTARSRILVRENKTYTCRAENAYGVDQRSLSLGVEEAAAGQPVDLLLLLVIPVLLLVLLVVVAVLGWRRRDLLRKSSLKRLPVCRNPSDVTTLPLGEVQESAPKTGSEYVNLESLRRQKQTTNTNEATAQNQDVCTYADIVFTNKPMQGAHEQGSTDQHKQEEVTYAVVAVQKDMQIGPS